MDIIEQIKTENKVLKVCEFITGWAFFYYLYSTNIAFIDKIILTFMLFVFLLINNMLLINKNHLEKMREILENKNK